MILLRERARIQFLKRAMTILSSLDRDEVSPLDTAELVSMNLR